MQFTLPLTCGNNRGEDLRSSSTPVNNNTGVKRRREDETEQVPMNMEEEKENINNYNANTIQSSQNNSTNVSCNTTDQFAQPAKKTKTGKRG